MIFSLLLTKIKINQKINKIINLEAQIVFNNLIHLFHHKNHHLLNLKTHNKISILFHKNNNQFKDFLK